MKKGISPVVATALLLVVAVVAVVGFNSWFNQYQSTTLSSVEQSSQNSGSLEIDTLIGSTLYIKNPTSTNLSLGIVKIGGKSCTINQKFGKGGFGVDLSSCLNVSAGVQEITIISNTSVRSKKVFVKSTISPSFVPKNNGTIVWARAINSSLYDYGYGITVDSVGNFYGIGVYGNNVSLGNGIVLPVSTGGYDAFVIKFNKSGTPQWAKRVNSTGDEDGRSVAVDSLGNVYTTGNYGGAGPINLGNGVILPTKTGFYDAYVIKYNSGGVAQWAKRINSSASSNYGRGIALDSNNNVYAVGYYQNGPINLGNGVILPAATASFDAYLIKYNNSGTAQWVKRVNSTGPDYGYGIAIDSTNNIYVSGAYQGFVNLTNNVVLPVPTGGSDAFIVKYSSTGVPQWSKRVNSSLSDSANAIALDSSNNVFTTGYYMGGIIALGNGVTLPASSGSEDVFIVKLDSSGTALWAKRINSTQTDLGNGITVDSTGAVYVTGSYRNSLINLGNSITLPLPTSDDAFIVKYDTSGLAQWADRIGAPGPDNGYGIDVDNLGNIFVAGSYNSGSINLGSGIILPLPPGGNANGFFLKTQ